jgi:hypothetical protein
MNQRPLFEDIGEKDPASVHGALAEGPEDEALSKGADQHDVPDLDPDLQLRRERVLVDGSGFTPARAAIEASLEDAPDEGLGVPDEKVRHGEELHDDLIGKTGPNPTNKQQRQLDVANARIEQEAYRKSVESREAPDEEIPNEQLTLPIYENPKPAPKVEETAFWFNVAAT